MTRLLVLLLLAAAPASAQDAIDLRAATIVNAPDVRAWPATASITSVSFDGAVSRITFTKADGADRWPDVVPPGFSGPIQYTWWLFRQVNGQWVGSAFIEMWYGRDGSGSASDPDVPSVYHAHWFYASRWTPLYGSGPIAVGERIGFMVTSGDARDSKGPLSVQERSNVVVFAASDRAAYTFGGPPPAPTPTPVPSPVPTPPAPPSPPPAPLPSVDLAGVYAQLAVLAGKLDALTQSVTDGRTENRTFFDTVKSEWKDILAKVATYGGPIIAAVFAGRATK